MTLHHYSNTPLLSVRSIEQVEEALPHTKPRGLWVSVVGPQDWREWCAAEDFSSLSEQICYEVTLVQNANILWMSTNADLLEFTERYAETKFGMPAIRWDWVAKDYQGIIIAPYIWSCRLDPSVIWYYGWDCASGCIWDKDAVEKWAVTVPVKVLRRLAAL